MGEKARVDLASSEAGKRQWAEGDPPDLLLAEIAKTVNPRLGEVLQRRRRAVGLGQAEVAERMGVARASISRKECGASSMSFAELCCYLEAVGWDLVTLQRELEPLEIGGRVLFAISSEEKALVDELRLAVRKFRRSRPVI